jgi:hypothetical protein
MKKTILFEGEEIFALVRRNLGCILAMAGFTHIRAC